MDDIKLVRLQPSNPREVRDAMYDSDKEIEARTGGQTTAKDVQAGENVGCISNNLENPFW